MALHEASLGRFGAMTQARRRKTDRWLGDMVRIDASGEPPATLDRSGVPLQLEVASQPAEQDQVVSEGGAKVFIAPRAAPILDDKVLDVQVSEDRERVQFVIGPQQGQPGEPG